MEQQQRTKSLASQNNTQYKKKQGRQTTLYSGDDDINPQKMIFNEDSQKGSHDESQFEKTQRTVMAKSVIKQARKEQEQQVSSFGDTLSAFNKTASVFN